MTHHSNATGERGIIPEFQTSEQMWCCKNSVSQANALFPGTQDVTWKPSPHNSFLKRTFDGELSSTEDFVEDGGEFVWARVDVREKRRDAGKDAGQNERVARLVLQHGIKQRNSLPRARCIRSECLSGQINTRKTLDFDSQTPKIVAFCGVLRASVMIRFVAFAPYIPQNSATDVMQVPRAQRTEMSFSTYLQLRDNIVQKHTERVPLKVVS